MFVLSIVKNHNDGLASRLFYRTKEDAMSRITLMVNQAAAKGLAVNPTGKENGALRIYNAEDPSSFDEEVSVYEGEPDFQLEPSIVSNTYVYRDSYFLECTHDMGANVVAVYLYDRRYPGDKCGVWSSKSDRYADDKEMLLAVLPDVEAVIEQLEEINAELEDGPLT